MRSFPAHYRLYEVLYKRKEPPTPDEIELAQGRKAMNADIAKAYVEKLESISNNIRDLLEKQAAAKEVRLLYRSILH